MERKEAPSERGSSGVSPSTGNLLRSQSWKGPQNSHAPPSHIPRNKQRPRLGADLPEPVDLVGGPIWCFPWPAACLVYLFSMFVSAMAQPVLTLGHLRGEPRKSQENGLFLELRCRQPGWETGFRPGLFPSALGNQRDSGGASWALVFPGP